MLVSLTGALPSQITNTPISKAALISKPYAKAAIMWTMFHHVATAFGAYGRASSLSLHIRIHSISLIPFEHRLQARLALQQEHGYR
jgi:hypothetical protein